MMVDRVLSGRVPARGNGDELGARTRSAVGPRTALVHRHVPMRGARILLLPPVRWGPRLVSIVVDVVGVAGRMLRMRMRMRFPAHGCAVVGAPAAWRRMRVSVVVTLLLLLARVLFWPPLETRRTLSRAVVCVPRLVLWRMVAAPRYLVEMSGVLAWTPDLVAHRGKSRSSRNL